jgi:hypothetical protein
LTITTTYYTDQLHLSGGSVTCTAGGSGGGINCGGSTAGPTALSYRISSQTAGGMMYVGLSGGNTWVLANSSGTTVGSIGSVASTAPGWPLIDGSSPPLVYLPGLSSTPGTVEPRTIGSAGFGAAPFVLPAFPAAITDMQLAQNGILFVLSSNTVHAVITDSIGGATAAGGTQTGAWPSACRDPCRSSNSGIQCPY